MWTGLTRAAATHLSHDNHDSARKVRALNRIAVLKQKAFGEKGFDGFLVANETNQFYFSGVQGASYLFILEKGESTIYVKGTNYEQAKADGKGFRVELVKRDEDLADKIAAKAKMCHIKKLAFDSLSIESYRHLAKRLRGMAKLKMQGNLISKLRSVKDEHELELMRKAGELTSLGMKVAYETIRPGVKEIEAAAEIEYAMRMKGGWGTAFETILASGVHSAFPHGGCTEREIRAGELVVIDIGATYQHYCSDMTRTVVAGKPSEKQKKLYEVVRVAQEKAHEAIRPKARAKDIDTVARKVIEDAGYGEYFVHGLGHGIGLEVHEELRLSQASKEKLMVGNVVTNEPGIYLVGFGGVRIEDTVLVRKRKAEKLTQGPYSLQIE
jgi:Xaa-Pro aminopeptidase